MEVPGGAKVNSVPEWGPGGVRFRGGMGVAQARGLRAVAWPAESTRQGMTHTGTATTAHLEKSSSIATRRPLDRVLVRHRCLLSPTDIE